MADRHIDIEHMIMQTNYELSLTTSSFDNTSVDMDYEKRIKELVQVASTLLDSNTKLGEKVDAQMKENQVLRDENSALNTRIEKLEGQLADLNRDKYGSSNEKNPRTPKPDKGTTKEEDEKAFIESEGKPSPSEAGADDDGATSSSVARKEEKDRDMSQRPDCYKTMHADLCVIHDCDLEKLKEMGLSFVRYTRPVDQFDRISIVRQDRYLYVWVRDKAGNEFPYFVPRPEDNSRRCILSNEEMYAMPSFIPHTSCTGNMLSDLVVNRFQYAISTGREMYRMFNEKMQMSKQTILNWLAEGSKFLKGPLDSIRKKLLKKGSVLYCDETWIDTKVQDAHGGIHYRKRYMWVLVNLTTKVCYYLFGSRKREVIEDFLADFKGILMTDAYAAYKYFNNLKESTHLCCWAHARRIFVSALQNYKDVKAEEYIELIGVLYKVEMESMMLHRTEEDVVNARKLTSIAVLNELKQKAELLLLACDAKQETISDKLRQALKYMLNNWTELIGYVNIGNVFMDNNSCERAVRPFTNLRKSFGGFSSENGGHATATYLSIVETCKLLKKPPLEFFRRFFSMIAEGRRDYDFMTQELLG
jgi:transposase